MKLYAPKYYKDFYCIADKCKHSCCIGWEIDIDNATYEKYSSLNGGYGDEIKKSIDSSETPHFILCGNDRCPHLNEKGLCKIILNVGEDHLCDICREHPRFYNYTDLGREVGIGISCEEACRIVLSSDAYGELVCIDEDEIEPEVYDFDATELRRQIYGILSDNSLPYVKKLNVICEKYSVSPTVLSDEEWHVVINSLEYLDESHKELFSLFSAAPNLKTEQEKILERALAYFIYRHCTEACDERDFRTSLGFCLFAERLLSSLSQEAKNNEEIFEYARIISEELEYCEENTEIIKDEFDAAYYCF